MTKEEVQQIWEELQEGADAAIMGVNATDTESSEEEATSFTSVAVKGNPENIPILLTRMIKDIADSMGLTVDDLLCLVRASVKLLDSPEEVNTDGSEEG